MSHKEPSENVQLHQVADDAVKEFLDKREFSINLSKCRVGNS
jgi:hypothetical protein